MRYTAGQTVFGSWVRQTAFSLTLSEPAIQDLLFMLDIETDCLNHNKNPFDYGNYLPRCQFGYLLRRGLIRRGDNGFILTKAGNITAQLLIEAGYENQRKFDTVFPERLCKSES